MIEALHGDHYEVIDECEAYACNIYYLFMLLIYQPMWSFFFFFQAEDGIRYYKVTGVQTCALPIYSAFRIVPDHCSWERSQSDVQADCKSGDGGTSCVGNIDLCAVHGYDVPAVCISKGGHALANWRELTVGENRV